MGTTLTGTTPQDTYDSLIKVTDNGPLTGSLKKLTDGLGNDSSLSLSTTAASIAGTLAVTGDAAFDTNTLFVDAANNRVGVGTTTPSSILQLVKSSNSGSASAFPSLQVRNTLATQGDGASTFNFANVLLSSGDGVVNVVLASSFAAAPAEPSGQLNVATNHPLVFRTNNTERMRVLAGGGLTFNGDTAAANALDDYEEGTWTMGVKFGGASAGVTADLSGGTYTKIGRQVTVNGFLRLTNKGSSTGGAILTGLPFTIANNNANFSAASLRLNNITFANQFQGVGNTNTTTIVLQEITEAGVLDDLTNADFANNSQIMLSLTYFV
jgi:hypothetical protein